MLNPVVLVNENITDEEIGQIVSASGNERRVTIFDPKVKGERIVLPDFGTFFVGYETSKQNEADEIFSMIHGEDDAAWIVPPSFKMAHLMKRLGLFPSVGQAMKNGWNMDIPFGFSQHIVRINRIRGILTVFKNA